MQLIQELRREHELIEQVLGSLCSHAEQRAAGAGDPADGPHFVAFFRTFAGEHHHATEEHVLFPALASRVGLPRDRGPLLALTRQHEEMAGLLDRIEAQLAAGGSLVEPARAYAHALWRHIDAENSVLLPEAEARLRRAGTLELVPLDPAPGVAEARAQGERLIAAYPPRHDATAMRGDGCVICPSFGTACDGLEREWWNDSEWEEFADHLG
jgi:hemerythrin-like domain-containing protein